jgi:hypothetical protein
MLAGSSLALERGMSPEREAAIRYLQDEIRLYRAALAAVRCGRSLPHPNAPHNLTPAELEALIEDARRLLARLACREWPDGITMAGFEAWFGPDDENLVAASHAA